MPSPAPSPRSRNSAGALSSSSPSPSSQRHQSGSRLLRVGSIVTLSVKHADGQTLPVGTYLKHDLAAVGPLRSAAVHEERFRTEHFQVYLADTGLTQLRWGTPVMFDEEILLMDGGDVSSVAAASAPAPSEVPRERRLWNHLNTSAWGSGYVAPRSPDTPGLLILRIADPDSVNNAGATTSSNRSVPLDSSSLLLIPANMRHPQPLSVYRKSSSALAGGYLVTDGSGSLAHFRFREIVGPLSQESQSNLPSNNDGDGSGLSSGSSRPPRGPADPHLVHYGETVRFRCGRPALSSPPQSPKLSPQPTPEDPSTAAASATPTEHWLGNYLKHGLLAIGPCEGRPELFSAAGFTLWPTQEVMMGHDDFGSNGGDPQYLTGVTYNQPLMIVDCESGLRWNVNTKTWNSGYLTVRDLDEAGGVCVSMHRADLLPERRGVPVRFGDRGVWIAVHRAGYPARRVSVYRTRGTALHPEGGYLVVDGSGSEFEMTLCRSLEDEYVEFSRPQQPEGEEEAGSPTAADATRAANGAAVTKSSNAMILWILLAVIALYWIDSTVKLVFGGRGGDAPATSVWLILVNLATALLAGVFGAVALGVPVVVDNLPLWVQAFFELPGSGGTHGGLGGQDGSQTGLAIDGEESKEGEEEKESEEDRRLNAIRALYTKVEADAAQRQAQNRTALAGVLRNDLARHPIPPRFVRAEAGNPEKQKQRYLDTLKWRLENAQDSILLQAHPHFELVKSSSTQYYHKTDREGRIVYIERPKDIDLVRLRKAGVGMPELLFHYRWITEFLWQVLDPDEDEGRTFSILDMSGIGLSDFAGDVIEFVRAVSGITSTHYPERSAHIFLVNASFSFSAIWRLVKTFLSKETLAKTHVYRSGFQKELLKFIPAENLPVEYGGTCRCPGGCVKSPMEAQMADFCRFVNEKRKQEGTPQPEQA